MNASGFFAMGGYGAFVWPCILLTVAVLAWNALAALRLHAAAKRDALRRLDAGRGRT